MNSAKKNNYPPILILAGGKGTRLKTLHPNLPKYLAPINDEPFAYHQLRLLKKMGLQEIILCVGEGKEKIKAAIGDGKQFGLQISYSEDDDLTTGTGGAVKKASNLVSSYFGVLYGDAYLDFDFHSVFQAFLNQKKSGLMTVFHNKNLYGKSNVTMKDQRIIRYDKDPSHITAEYIDYGFLLFSKKAMSNFKKKHFDLSELIQDLIKKGELATYEIPSRFYEIGTPDALDEFQNYEKSYVKH